MNRSERDLSELYKRPPFISVACVHKWTWDILYCFVEKCGWSSHTSNPNMIDGRKCCGAKQFDGKEY